MKYGTYRSRISAVVAASALGLTALTLPAVDSAQAADASAGEKIEYTLTRTDSLGDTVRLGDRLEFKITYRNTTTGPLTAYPADSNLLDFDVKNSPKKNCRWASLPAKTQKECGFGYHIVNIDDLTAGTYVPTALWKVTNDREGTDVVEDNIKLTLDPINVSSELPHDPATDTQEVQTGVGRHLATPGLAGYACHRIPAIAKTPINGWILTAWDGRPYNCADAPQPNTILGRISKDGAQSWSELKVIKNGHRIPVEEKYGYSDPSFVVDEEANKIFVFSVKSYDHSFQNSWRGDETTDDPQRKILHASVAESSDDGQTWSEPRVITKAVTKEYDWRSRFAASGQGIQLKYGPHKGRLVQQFTVAVQGDPNFYAYSVYSDDHGKTWQHGEKSQGGADENKVVELSDGRLMMNSRSRSAEGGRLVAYSEDGGETWGPWIVERRLTDPVNNAGFVRAFPDAPQHSMRAKILLFSNANSNAGRRNGFIRISYDDGKNWTYGRQFESGDMAYSTITPLGDGKYGLLYESGNYANIDYMQVDNEWLGLEDPGPEAMDPAWERDQALQELENLKAEKSKLEKSLTDANAEIERLKAELEKSAEKCASCAAKLDEAQNRIKELEAALAQAPTQEKVDELNNEIRNLQAQIVQLKAKIAELEGVDVEPSLDELKQAIKDRVAVAPPSFVTPMHDVNIDSPFSGEIDWMVREGISTGYYDSTFRPFISIDREAMAAFLYRLAGEPKVTAGTSFKDVSPATTQFSKEIAWMAQSGVSTGWPDGTFRPKQPVTRAAMAAFLHRFCQVTDKCSAGITTDLKIYPELTRFKDIPLTHQFAADITWLHQAGITTGWPDGTFRPETPIARNAMAAFIYRLAHNG